MTQKLTVKATEVLKIHEIACPRWKATISSYLSRIDEDQNITFFPVEIKCMFKAATESQLPVLEEVFGKATVVIEYDKLQTGSIVKLHPKYGQLVGDNRNMDLSKAVNIVFANTPHSIDCWGKFVKKCYYPSYYTFEQNGVFVRYCTNELDYIAEVIEY
jgi:hypothetical protein